jgi:hypothetical protein
VEKVNAQEELDSLFAHCEDVDHYIGYTMVPDERGRETRLAYARVIFPQQLDRPLKMRWPEQLIYRRAVEAGSGVKLFIIGPPGDPLHPLIAAEWDEEYQLFIDAAEKLKMFVIEFVMPSKKYVAMVVDGKIKSSNEQDLTPEDYDILANKSSSPAPDSPGALKS